MIKRVTVYMPVLLSIFSLSLLQAQIPDDSAGITRENLGEKLSASLEAASQYQYGENREALYAIDVMVQFVLNNAGTRPLMEKHFLKFLESDASPAAKQFICRKLSLVGSNKSAGVLEKLLRNEALAEYSLYALERIPDPAMDNVLIKALVDTRGPVRISVISALGIRQCANAVDRLIPFVYGNDAETAKAALDALGRIGNEASRTALNEARLKLTGPLRLQAMNSLISAADKLAAAGETEPAMRIYKSFCAPDNVRAAALNGIFAAAPGSSGDQILRVLEGNDRQLKSVAIRRVSRKPAVGRIPEIAACLPWLEPQNQIELITALAVVGDKTVLNDITALTGSGDAEVQIAAVTALGDLGTTDTVPLLAEIAAAGDSRSEAAHAALCRLAGKEIDDTIVSMLKTAEPPVLTELLRCTGERYMKTAASAVIPFLTHAEGRVVLEAVRSLGIIAGPEHLEPLLRTLIETKASSVRKACGTSIVMTARRKGNTDSPAAETIAAFGTALPVDAQSSLMQIIGELGDVNGLPLIRKALDSKNMDVKKGAIAALTAWPDSRPLEHLWRVAEADPKGAAGILALRGYIGLVRKDPAIKDDDKAVLYRAAWDRAAEKAEKLQVLGALGQIAAPAALELAAAAITDPGLQAEAEIAVIQVSRRIWRDHPELTKKVLEMLKDKSADENRKNQAENLLGQIE